MERLGAVAKCAPPLGVATDQEDLWAALLAGQIAFVASDHSPVPAAMKQSADFFQVWGGISGVQTTLGLLLAAGHEQRGLPFVQVAELTSRKAAPSIAWPARGGWRSGPMPTWLWLIFRRRRPLDQNEFSTGTSCRHIWAADWEAGCGGRSSAATPCFKTVAWSNRRRAGYQTGDLPMTPRDHLVLYVNGRRHAVRGAAAFRPLSEFLRADCQLTGTKVVCAEGDCGSCSVLVGRPRGGQIEYQPVTSCIQYLAQLDATHIVTVEGLKLRRPIESGARGDGRPPRLAVRILHARLRRLAGGALRRTNPSPPGTTPAAPWSATCAAARAMRRSSMRPSRSIANRCGRCAELYPDPQLAADLADRAARKRADRGRRAATLQTRDARRSGAPTKPRIPAARSSPAAPTSASSGTRAAAS